ncbi:pentatricopeptide repeat protein [Grosmannia clavigera kw1407]|uniref:Pentatricopeptide repeat protein n=1 Tax=Grosmannia clavigera (strain kw1407 / UAMH 11150) TaxID=655863 RepID=F0XMY3_GROCL|nr:pentatricopeptide repeat protein [Grosmannia clavigera kw1407]EFX00769.1 pentatricopeptide repeat protein [Grosmannia clavigera kw1407]
MPPTTALLSDLGMRGPFVCRSCLSSLRAAAGQRPPWTMTLAMRTVMTQPGVRARRTGSAAARRPSAANEGVTVRLFEQEDDGQLRQVADEEADSNGNYRGDALDREIERQLAELEGKLRDTAQLVRRLEKNGPAKKRADRLRRKYDLIREVEAEGERDEDAAVRIGYDGLSLTARRHVRNLNNVLRLAAHRLQQSPAALDDRMITALYARYGSARTGLSEAWHNVPAAAWTVLWTVLAWEGSSAGSSVMVKNPRRMAQIYYLAKDMQAARVPLTDAQQLLALEAMFVEGWPAAALDNWKRGAASLGTRPATATDYWELGVRMCALHGDLDRASRAAERLFGRGGDAHEGQQDGKTANPRVLLQLIRAAAAQDDLTRATAAFRRLQTLLGDHMGLEDYDEVVGCFLANNQTEQAFGVFVEMMGLGRTDRPSTSRRRLPPCTANAFFFGKWLKRLIGAGDLDGALRVLVFMQAHGVMPAVVQVNGLLGAWLRTAAAADQRRADVLAWRMIAARRLFVDLRRRSQGLVELQAAAGGKKTKETSDKAEKDDLLDTFTAVPRASIETFALLADNYKDRGRVGQLEALWVAFQECEMERPSTGSATSSSSSAFMMNQLLASYVHDGRPDEARDMYHRMRTSAVAVRPNVHTFLVLFRSLTVHRLPWGSLGEEPRAADRQLCRELFAEMVEMLGTSSTFSTSTTTSSTPSTLALGRLVLHSFRKTGDYVGLVVAVRALRPLLDHHFTVSHRLAVELVAEAPMVDGVPFRPESPAVRRRILRASELVDALLRERAQLRQQHHRHHQPSPDDLADDLAAIVAHYYRHKCAVDNDLFAAMHAAAVDDLAVARLLQTQH